MQALVYDEKKIRLIRDYPEPKASAGEALIRLILAGICRTDLEISRGYMDFRGVLGHEFVGVVEESEDKSLIGKRVVGEINARCGRCSYCQRGLGNHCPERTVLGILKRDGCLADYFLLPPKNLHLVPDSVPDEAAVFTEPLAAALQSLEQVHIKPTDLCVVIGDGKLGLLVAQVVSLTGCELLVTGHHQDNLDILNRLGIQTKVAAAQPLEKKVDVVIECSGRPEGLRQALNLLKPRGKLILKSTFAAQNGSPPFNPAQLVIDEITLIGSRCGPFGAALRLLNRGLVETSSLISAIYPLDEAEAAFTKAGGKGILKVLLRP
ncbi:MAG: alcohol dehydrogenase catalytic domain-containing protein [bacterium]